MKKQGSRLYAALHEGLPGHRSWTPNVLNVRKLAEDLAMSFQSIYRWFDRGRLPQHQFKRLVALERSTLTRDILIPFVVDE